MSPSKPAPRFQVVSLPQLPPQPCPCGITRRAFTDEADGIVSLHLVDIGQTAKTHYHQRLTEIYYVLEGHGQMELDGQLIDVEPGTAVLIKPECRHRAIGDLRILNIPIPAFDPNDEWFD